MNIVNFTREHIANAKKLALSCYQEEQNRVPDLPGAKELTDLTYFADNGLGAAAYEGNTMTGFLCCTEPFDHAFGSTDAKGIFSPMGTHAFQTAALAGGGADIVIMDNSGHAIDLAAMGLLYPLSELATPEDLVSQYQEGPLNSGKFQGEYYSVPWYMDCCGLYYNKERLDELGLSVPTNWEELSDALEKVKEAGYGGIITYQSAYAFYSFFYQNECPVIDTSGETPSVVIDNEQGKEAWDYICSMIENGGLVESFKEATTWDKVYESFANGEATFLLGGDWCANGVDGINPDLDYGITTMVEGKTQATVLGGWTWNINANSKNPELAYDLIQYINSEKGDPILAVQGKISARKDFDYAKALEGKERLKVFTDEFPYTCARPAVINEKAIDELITNAILEVDYGKATAEEALKSLTQKLNENIASNYK